MYVFGIERVKSLTSDSIKAETPQRMDNIRPIPYPDFRLEGTAAHGKNGW